MNRQFCLCLNLNRHMAYMQYDHTKAKNPFFFHHVPKGYTKHSKAVPAVTSQCQFTTTLTSSPAGHYVTRAESFSMYFHGWIGIDLEKSDTSICLKITSEDGQEEDGCVNMKLNLQQKDVGDHSSLPCSCFALLSSSASIQPNPAICTRRFSEK